jgi:hypothetical protein
VNAETRKDARPNPGPAERTVGDATWAEAYSAGYGEGLRESLKELLQHASRGHTATELRILVESRLARIAEDIELKRKSLMAPPRRPAWGALFRPPSSVHASPGAAAASPPSPTFLAGNSYLFREERPSQGIRFVREVAPRHSRIVWVSIQDAPALPELGENVLLIRPSGRPSPDGSTSGMGPGEVAGQLQRLVDSGGSVLVYVDAIEFFLTEYGTEPTIRFATWLGTWAKENRSTSVVSLDPNAMEETDLRRLQRTFSILA